MKLLGLSGVLFLAFIFLYEAGQFELSYISGGISLVLCCAVIYLGNRKTGPKEGQEAE